MRNPPVTIEDSPVYPWRGMNLDCSRHFMTKDFVKRYIDLPAFYRMNVFHWNLTNDQGWRVEIKKYPRLTEVGAWRMHYRVWDSDMAFICVLLLFLPITWYSECFKSIEADLK